MSEFIPPVNDFYNKAAKLSMWDRSDSNDENVQIVDGFSSEESSGLSIKRLSENDSFAGRS